ncbi:MAG TPA: sodium/proton-translocating pyrophosphatase, partial [Anaerolineae bacterium]|nr:sodium/proton-translocating pyrophosphatase [Anaerolineae bacterium]
MAVWLYLWVHRQDPGTPQARKVAHWIREGAISYLKKLYRALLMLAAIIALLLFIVFGLGNQDPSYGLKMSLAFLTGALLSSVAGYMGMTVA